MNSGLRKAWQKAVEDNEIALLLVRSDSLPTPQIALGEQVSVFARHMFEDDEGVGMDFEGQGYVLGERESEVVVSPDSDMIGVLSGTDSDTLVALIEVMTDLGWQRTEVLAGPITEKSVEELTQLRPFGSRLEFQSGANREVEAVLLSLQASPLAGMPAAVETVSDVDQVKIDEPEPDLPIQTEAESIEEIEDQPAVVVGPSPIPEPAFVMHDPSPAPASHTLSAPDLSVPSFHLSPPAPAADVTSTHSVVVQPVEAVPPAKAIEPESVPAGPVSVKPAPVSTPSSVDEVPVPVDADLFAAMKKLVETYPVSRASVMSASLGKSVQWHANSDTADVRSLVGKVTQAEAVAELLTAVVLHLGYTGDQEELCWAAVAEWLRKFSDPQEAAAAMQAGIVLHDLSAACNDGFSGRSPFVESFARKSAGVKASAWLTLMGKALQLLHAYGESAGAGASDTQVSSPPSPAGMVATPDWQRMFAPEMMHQFFAWLATQSAAVAPKQQ